MPFISSQYVHRRSNSIIKYFKVIVFLILLFTVYLRWSLLSSNNKTKLIEHENDNIYLPRANVQSIKHGRLDLAKYIHLDLKGAPPKAENFYELFFNFLEKLQMGIKGVVIEYEDTLPLEGNLANITHRNGYTKLDMKLIEESAKKHQLEIIPLIQTFGHLEWILKLREYESYRDDPDLPMVISPCFNLTYVLFEDLLQQTLNMHPNSNIIHIGCDEVTLKNLHPHCQAKQMSISETYIEHIRRIVDIVRKIRPGIRILIWDDILRGSSFIHNEKLLRQLEGLIEPVSWNYYTTFDDNYKSLSGWNIYPKFFKNIWAASAFKGGLHRFSMITNSTHHVLNNRQWLHFIESSTFQHNPISAIILTGWSRFDHFMPICDILPTSYTSLLYSLHVLNTDEYLTDDSNRDCDILLKSINKESTLCDTLPGRSIWSSIISLKFLLLKIQNRLKLLNTIAPEYNRKYLFVRRYDLKSRLSELQFLLKKLLQNKQKLNQHFSNLYSKDVIDEWIDLYLTPVENQINRTFIEYAPVYHKTIWERRPLT
ncbi:unnamed protein product [Adineta steineri]|uniref:beta-N-acetylhexosaminidase n=1 Tax=Adineta steineri TaxID=433720 RepID=A0A814UWF3_9BILA|nr:unnamed protein product [Adineta steineri]